ncbi:NADH-cytochrome b5 reductase-like isoform X2 [Drosophila nasuta]|uniref:NADH-cytochrome b5 reductase-like isoform X2 n=1 Tax=Drosophila nasuta TaxID=42062 RepID=UPI00295E4C9A|nr:NADH-cytochrome b5 reductase-like isoform X2 [Drosophila nasuta]
MARNNNDDDDAIDESDCCGNGCTNCILDHKPQPSQRAQLAGKRNVILTYANFRLLSNEAYKADAQVRLMHFGYDTEHDAGDSILDIPPGHHVMLRTDATTPLLRPYSPYWSDFVAKEFKLLIKLQPNGPMSSFLANLQPLQVLQFRGPIGANYVHDANGAKCIVIIAQGVAIAPTLPLVAQILDNEDDMNRIRHLICAQDLEHVYFRERLLEFAQYWNYSSCLYLAHQSCTCCDSNTPPTDQPCEQVRRQLRYKEAAYTGRLEAKQLAAQLPANDAENIVVIIAGHSSFQREMSEQVAKVAGVSAGNIHLLGSDSDSKK